VRDDEFRRRRAPGREILGGVRVADEGRVVSANDRAMERRADAFVRLRADDDQAADGEVGEDGLERRLLERVRIPLLDERLTRVRAQLRDDLPLLASLREVVARVLYPDDRNLRSATRPARARLEELGAPTRPGSGLASRWLGGGLSRSLRLE
jgi:hypothetical protein